VCIFKYDSKYSVGKTSFIRSLLKRDFPGQRIGPEPTTDRFTAIMQSSPPSSLPSRSSPLSTGARSIAGQYQKGSDRLVPGHALVMQPEKGFQGLASFGNDFLSKFEGVEIDADILRNITIIDTPGVLSGEKQRIGRDYNYAEVVKWFAERADMIVVMFDAHKLDISDELRTVLDTLKPHHEKIRILLNKVSSLLHGI
jgi:GTPase SAR1 family protein